VCFVKHTLSKHNLGRLGLKPRPDPLFFFSFWAGSSPAMRARLDPDKSARLLVQTSNPADIFFFASVRELLVHPCYRKGVIKSEKEGTKWLTCCWTAVANFLSEDWCRRSLLGKLVLFLLHLFSPSLLHTLRSVFIVPDSLCMWETKFQSNSFSFLKFEFD